MPTKGGNKSRNMYSAQQVPSTSCTYPCGYSPFPQGRHHSSSVSEYSAVTPNTEHQKEKIPLFLKARQIWVLPGVLLKKPRVLSVGAK